MANIKNNTADVARALLAKTQLIQSVLSDVTFAAMNEGMARMKQRIFNRAQDADKKSLGKYISDPYKKKRQAAGRRIDKKDLQFSGSLFQSIQARKTGATGREIIFTLEGLADIGHWQEIQVANIRQSGGGVRREKGVESILSAYHGRQSINPVIIFTLNKDEQDRATKVGMAVFKKILK